jgi:nucleoside-diphosphate-sugar epimerase
MIEHLVKTPAQPSRVVIVGAYGFLGKQLNSYLSSQGVQIVAVDIPEIDLISPKSVEQLQGIIQADDAVVFASALTPDKGKDRGAMLKNITMGDHFCQFLERSSCSHIIYISSDAVYGVNERLIRETTFCQPDSLYGLGHWTREEMIKPVARQKNIPLLILRPNAMYGNGDTHNGYGPNRFVRSALLEQKISLFGNGEEKRSHIFIGDVVKVIGLSLARKSSGILNLTSGSSISFMELAQKVVSLVGKQVEIRPSPRQNPITHISFDPTEIFKAFPFFAFTSIDDGLSCMLKAEKQ